MHDLAIITVSTNEAHWIRPCLRTVFEHMGDISGDVVVVDNDSHDGTADVVATEFPEARTVWSRNHGFGHANNRALMTCNARYVLFLNPDTEILEGTLRRARRLMDERPTVGLVGARQITAEGRLDTTIRYFPNALRALGEALSAERLPSARAGSASARSTPRAYEREIACDWTSGSFMLARREALESAGYFDERFFMYSDETDLCRRIKLAGWEIRHLPQMTILHHDRKAGIKPHIESLGARHAHQVRAQVLLPRPPRRSTRGAVMLRHLLRAVLRRVRRGRALEARRRTAGRDRDDARPRAGAVRRAHQPGVAVQTRPARSCGDAPRRRRRALRPLLLIGAGGLARETLELVRAVNAAARTWELLGVLDDDPATHGRPILGVEVIGPAEAVHDHPDALVVACVASPGRPAAAARLVSRLALPPERYATLVHPAAVVPASASIGPGSVLHAGTVLTADVELGAHVAVMPAVVLTHDDVVEDGVTFGAGARVAGGGHDRARRLHRLRRAAARGPRRRRRCGRRHGRRRHALGARRRGLGGQPRPTAALDGGDDARRAGGAGGAGRSSTPALHSPKRISGAPSCLIGTARWATGFTRIGATCWTRNCLQASARRRRRSGSSTSSAPRTTDDGTPGRATAASRAVSRRAPSGAAASIEIIGRNGFVNATVST